MCQTPTIWVTVRVDIVHDTTARCCWQQATPSHCTAAPNSDGSQTIQWPVDRHRARLVARGLIWETRKVTKTLKTIPCQRHCGNCWRFGETTLRIHNRSFKLSLHTIALWSCGFGLPWLLLELTIRLNWIRYVRRFLTNLTVCRMNIWMWPTKGLCHCFDRQQPWTDCRKYWSSDAGFWLHSIICWLKDVESLSLLWIMDLDESTSCGHFVALSKHPWEFQAFQG